MARAGLREWALKGAEQRLLEIAAEAARTYAEFPELRDSGDQASTTATSRIEDKPRRRTRSSLASRKRMAEAQRKRWAAVGATADRFEQPAATQKVAREAPKKR